MDIEQKLQLPVVSMTAIFGLLLELNTQHRVLGPKGSAVGIQLFGRALALLVSDNAAQASDVLSTGTPKLDMALDTLLCKVFSSDTDIKELYNQVMERPADAEPSEITDMSIFLLEHIRHLVHMSGASNEDLLARANQSLVARVKREEARMQEFIKLQMEISKEASSEG